MRAVLFLSAVLFSLALTASAQTHANCDWLQLSINQGTVMPAWNTAPTYTQVANTGTGSTSVTYNVNGIAAGTSTITFNLKPFDTMSSISWMVNGGDAKGNQGVWTSVDQFANPVSVTIPIKAGYANQIVFYVACDFCVAIYIFNVPCPPSSVIGDPQFTGLKGQSYQVHGMSDEVYNLITDADLQVNSRFVFLTEGKCPIVDGKIVRGGCWSHPGTYLGEIGLKTAGGDRIQLIAGDNMSGYESVTVNGRELNMNDGVIALQPSGYVVRNDTHTVSVEAGNFAFEFSNSDLFINQKIRVLDWNRITAHGLLGQTHVKVNKMNSQGLPIEGTVDDYNVGEKNVWGDSFVYNRFNAKMQ